MFHWLGPVLQAVTLFLLRILRPPQAGGTPFSRDVQLSEHFALREFISPNDPEGWAYVEQNWAWLEQELRFLCRHVLEPIRAHFGRAVRITSGIRSWIHNRRIGGATLSQHPKGKATDISVDGVSLLEVHAFAGTIPAVGGLARGPGFVHIDTRRRWFGVITRWTY